MRLAIVPLTLSLSAGLARRHLAACLATALATGVFHATDDHPAGGLAPHRSRAVIAASPSGTDNPDDNLPEVREAGEAVQKGDMSRAAFLLRGLSAKRPDLPPPDVMLARLQIQSRRYSQGRATLEQAAMRVPDSPDVYLTLAGLALNENRFTDAELLLERVTNLTEAAKNLSKTKREEILISVYSGLAVVWEQRRHWPKTIEQIDRMLALNPKPRDRAAAAQRYARALFYLGRVEPAYAQLQVAVRLHSEFPPAEIGMAGLYTTRARETDSLASTAVDPLMHPVRVEGVPESPAASDDFRNAENWLKRALASEPRNPVVLTAVINWMLERDRPQEALKPLETLTTVDPDTDATLRAVGLVYRWTGQLERAEPALEKLYNRNPADGFAANQLVLALADQDSQTKRQRAVELALVHARANPRDAITLTVLGWACRQNNRLPDAERFLREAVQLAGGRVSAETAYFLAVVINDRGGKPDDVRQLLKSALSTSGGFLYRKAAEGMLQRLGSPAGK